MTDHFEEMDNKQLPFSESEDLGSKIDETIEQIVEKNNNDIMQNKEKFNYFVLDYDKILNCFAIKGKHFKDNNTAEHENNELYDIVKENIKPHHIIIPVYKGSIVKKNLDVDVFTSPLLLLRLNINLVGSKNKSVINTSSIINSMSNMDISTLISQIMSTPLGNNNENAINSQNDVTDFTNLTNQLMNIYNNSSQNMQSLARQNEEKYKDEISQIMAMGFDDKEKIIQSLVVCNGDIEQAINYYLSAF